MHIVLATHIRIPALRYGGTERIIAWLGRALAEKGHVVGLLGPAGSTWHYGPLTVIEPARPLEAQIPRAADVFHSHIGLDPDFDGKACQTIHGNAAGARLHRNSIFVSADHAARHGGTAFVHNGLDPRVYPEPDLGHGGKSLAFLAKAAWKVKNVRGAIRVARKAGRRLDVLGGYRLNLKMGLRLTLDPNARFHGMVDDAGKADVLGRSAGLLFPVRWHEPFGLAVIEAMYFGLPVFATPYGSLTELVPQHVGCLSDKGDVLAEAIRDIGRFDRAAIHAHFQENFTAERMTARYLSLYERIAAGESLHPASFTAPAAPHQGLLPWTD